jgi:hypothetical protein
MSSIVSGIGRAISGVVKGVTDIVKSVASSGLGKALIMGAAIYFGGAALMGGFGEAGLAGGGSFFEGASAGLSNAATGISNAWAGLTGPTAETITGDLAGTGAGGTIAESSSVLPSANTLASNIADEAVASGGASANQGIIGNAITNATGGLEVPVSSSVLPPVGTDVVANSVNGATGVSGNGGIVGNAMQQATTIAPTGVTTAADYAKVAGDYGLNGSGASTGFWNGLGTTGKGMAILAGTNLAGGLIQGAAAQSQANEARNRYNTNVGTRLWNT